MSIVRCQGSAGLPDAWTWKPLSAVCEKPERGNPASRFNETFRYTDVGSVAEGLSSRAVAVAEAPSRARQFVLPGDTLFSCVRVNLRRVIFVRENETDVASTAFAVLRPRSDALDPRFLHYWTRTDAFVRALEPLQRGNQPPSVLDDDVRTQVIPVAPLEIQRRIVARIDELFSELDDGEAALARARADLGTYRKSLLKAAVTGALTADWRVSNPSGMTGAELLARILSDRRSRWCADPRNSGKRYAEPAGPDVAGLGCLPDGWTWATLAQLAFVTGGATVDAKRKAVDPVTVPYLRVANVQRGWLDLEKVKTIELERSAIPGLRLAPGDLLLNEGGDRDKVGRGWVFEGQLVNCVHQNHVFKARPASDVVFPKLVSSYLNEFGRAFFMEQGKQTTNLASISLSKLSKAPVPVPPLGEAEVIWSRLEDGRHDLSSELEADASALRQSILAAAFRGELT